MPSWATLRDGDRVELGLVQVDIAGHSALTGSDAELRKAKTVFRDQMEGVATSRNGNLFSWAGDGGCFMFQTGAGEGFDALVFSAIQMLGIMPAVNEEIATRTDLSVALSVRVSCDSGIVAYSKDPGTITADFVNRFMKYERQIGLLNSVTVTERVWRQLSSKLRARFLTYKHCAEVDSGLYRFGGQNPTLPDGEMMKHPASPGAPHLLHHVSLAVRNLGRSVAFYRSLLLSDPLVRSDPKVGDRGRPSFPFEGAWFDLPNGSQLHLVLNPVGTFRQSEQIEPRDCHFALQVVDYVKAQELLIAKNIPYLPDPFQLGRRQLYFLDPDWHVVELNAVQ